MRINKKQRLIEIQQIARDRGGECQAAKYVNNITKMPFVCAEGHEWEATSHNIKDNDSWCPYCAGLAPLTLEIIQQEARDRGGVCTSSKYVNNRTKMGFRCVEGHEWEATPDSVKNHGNWCPHCAGNAPLTLEIIQQEARDRGGVCTSSKYVNNGTKMGFRCAEGHEWEATPNMIKDRGSWCPICRNKSENAVRTMLKYALELDFPPYSPKSLKRLGIELRNTAENLMHLDGFNLDICAAFEYHGYQHTDGESYFHGYIPDSFERRQKDDELKREQCERAGIVLFEVYQEQHGVWPHLNRLYSGLIDVLEEKGVQVTGKPNLSDSAWMGLITSDTKQTKLMSYLWPLAQESEKIIQI